MSALTTIVASAVFFIASPVLATAADSCSNAQFRVGPSAGLPDCRAYEMVSPADTNGASVNPASAHGAAVSGDGQHVFYVSALPFTGNPSGPSVSQYRSTRTAAGWTTTALAPSASETDVSGVFAAAAILDAPADFSTPLFISPYSLDPNDQDGDPVFPNCPYVPGGSGCGDLYVRNADGSWRWVSQDGQPKTVDSATAYAGESADQGHVLFQAQPALSPNASGQVTGWALYDRTGGATTLVGVKTDGSLTSACGAVIGAPPTLGFGGDVINGSAERSNAVSSDARRVFFESPDPRASGDSSCSPQQGGSQPVGVYLRQDNATTTEISLSQKTGSVGTPAPDGATFQAATSDGSKALFTSPDALTDDASGGSPYLYEYDINASGDPLTFLAGSAESVVGFSSDLSYVYFRSNVLALSHDGTVTALPGGHHLANGGAVAEVTPDASRLVFVDSDQASGRYEVYMYDAGTGQTSCLSCSPGGAPAVGDSSLGESLGTLASRAISDDGSRVFFQSPNALVPQAANGQQTVYEWESGAIHAISDPTAPYGSRLFGASASGDDVFFATADALVPQDQTNGNKVVYDARVGGGLAGPPQPPPVCQGEACQGPLTQPPPAPVAASVTFFGSGNATRKQQPARIRILRKVVHGARFVLRIQVPAKGRIIVSGAGTRSARRSLGRAGIYRLRIGLTRKAREKLLHNGKLKLHVRVSYVSASGSSSSPVALTVKR